MGWGRGLREFPFLQGGLRENSLGTQEKMAENLLTRYLLKMAGQTSRELLWVGDVSHQQGTPLGCEDAELPRVQ